MLILIICILACAAGIIIIARTGDLRSDWPYGIGMSLVAIFGLITILIGSLSVIVNVTAQSALTSYNVTYNSLVYQLENDVYDNDNDIGKQQLYSDITSYNRDVVKGKVMQNNIWIGCVCPDIYDDLNTIDFN